MLLIAPLTKRLSKILYSVYLNNQNLKDLNWWVTNFSAYSSSLSSVYLFFDGANFLKVDSGGVVGFLLPVSISFGVSVTGSGP